MYKLSNSVQSQFSAVIKGLLSDMAPDLKLVSGFALTALVLAYIPYINNTVIAFVFNLAMIMFMPGYAFVLTIFPGKTEIDITGRALLSFALSVLATFLSALILNMASRTVNIGLLMVILTIPTIIFTLKANRDRKNIPPEVRFSIDFDKVYKRAIVQFFPANEKSLNKGMTAILIITLTLSLGVLAYIVIAPGQGDRYTEFYLLGPDGMADHYPVKYSLGDINPVIVGVTNNEGKDMGYDLVITLNDNITKTIIFSEKFTVANKKTWENTINLMPDCSGNKMDMEFLLYKNDNMTTPYSRLYLWVNVTDPKTSEV